MDQNEGNQLGEAVSPYLLQHKDNPVHWREWSAEALGEAEATDKPILLSVGYAACHWCHVMAHESFEDEATAAIMNRAFVNVKVDREERPDIDHLYMSALHAMGEQGGWPMTMFLTPRGEPFFGGTYFPKVGGQGRPSFTELLTAVAQAWGERRGKLQQSADALADHLGTFLARAPSGAELDPSALVTASERIAKMVDTQLGGMKGAPKFPNAPHFELLARSAYPAGPALHQAGFMTTLNALCEGGIYDHVGGGLHRYSTDDKWLVPHFEKMLYDNAQFLQHLLWGWRASGKDLYRRRIDETIDWLEREMLTASGAFSASLDADSLNAEGHMEEGAFYVWPLEEIDRIVGADRVGFRRRYDVTRLGNWEGKVILNRLGGFGSPEETFETELAALFEARARRPRPGRDDKVLADWNGLAIQALAEIAATLDHAKAKVLAENAFAGIMDGLFRDGRLFHAMRDGRVSGSALSSDYGAMIGAAAKLFALTLDKTYLDAGRRLADALEAWHGDGEGGHFMTASDADDVLIRPRGDGDEAVPSPTALVLNGLALLAELSGDNELARHVDDAAAGAAARIADSPAAFPGILSALDRLSRASSLALIGTREEAVLAEMISAANRTLDLSRLDLVVDDPARLPADNALSQLSPGKRPAAILCEDRTCRAPVYDAEGLNVLLRPA